MDGNSHIFRWTGRDRLRHLVPAIPLLLFYAGAVYLLAAHSPPLVGGFVLLWLATNLAVAGICAGCPYRGGYCPGLSQLYVAPFLATVLYRGPKTKPSPRTLKVSLALLGLFGIGSYAYAFYWLFTLYWPQQAMFVLVLLGLLLVHMPLSFFLLCPGCGYQDTCPMARVHKAFQKGRVPERGE